MSYINGKITDKMNILTLSNITKNKHYGVYYHAVLLRQVCLVLKWQKWQWRREPDKALAHVVSVLPVISLGICL